VTRVNSRCEGSVDPNGEFMKFSHTSEVSKDVGSGWNIGARIGKARAASHHLSKCSMEFKTDR